ncbi:hypothetical protein GCM10027445_61060 [Amycolatopsis endophytica]|uniref:DUF2795 domain-containing protein n=1 Tax=Amycolatopsis endophytica TaxID=860233 RepID=A0A853B6W9_9PSEU|nr:DUF2795 domain-containing protein [Amycolatopsis endophytica]NYI90504.1 hypothetical protein [Amycolatopsis endophytica]
MTTPDPDRLRALLSEVDFPCERSELIRQATAHGADDSVLGHLGAIPDSTYRDLDSVTTACGEIT